jgi:dipeptidyl aminopeptidase/acylaminoacyl peptidase
MEGSMATKQRVPLILLVLVSLAACSSEPYSLDPTAGSLEGTGGIGGSVSLGSGGTVQAQGGNCTANLPSDILQRWIAFDSDQEDFRRQLYRMHPDGSSMTRLLTSAAIDLDPAFSPDGTRIAFASNRDGTFQIYLLQLDTGQLSPVTHRQEGADQPSFSRDGTLIAFHSGASVYVIRPDGTGERLVATGSDSFNAYYSPQFSADDTELVFDRNNEIDAVRLDGTGLRRIVQNWTTEIKAPAVSPDGYDLAYQVYCDDSGASVWTTPFATTTNPCEGRRVTPVGQAAAKPAWASSALLAYELVQPDTNLARLAVISRATGSVPCVITPDTADYRNPAWSP